LEANEYNSAGVGEGIILGVMGFICFIEVKIKKSERKLTSKIITQRQDQKSEREKEWGVRGDLV
jgi:hypothetical protein